MAAMVSPILAWVQDPVPGLAHRFHIVTAKSSTLPEERVRIFSLDD